jgi:cytochrome c peroxidase
MQLRNYSFIIAPLVCVPLAVVCASNLDIVVDDGEVELVIDWPLSGLAHGRVESSTDLQQWQTLTAVGLVDGQAEVSVATGEGEELLVQRFFRVVEDDSQGNVLNLPEIPDTYANVLWPEHLAAEEVMGSDNTPMDNVVTDEGALLGRVLFYDQKLSANYSVSCASCHQQEHGFSDPAPLSVGFAGELTGRNSMGLANSQFYARGHFFWDERANTLEDQVLEPIQNVVEMGLTTAEAVKRVAGYSYYEPLFIDAFGDAAVTAERIGLALAQFVRSIVSSQSRYDLGEANGFADFTPQELLGQQLFNGRGRCVRCHEGPNFVGTRVENNGLEFPYMDEGVGAVTGRDRDLGKFKMSSLRNIEKTAPYMHDGRFATLEAVIDHYDHAVVANPNLGGPLRDSDGTARQLNLSQTEKDALIAFLRTLTDETTLTDPKWSDPFAEGAQGSF